VSKVPKVEQKGSKDKRNFSSLITLAQTPGPDLIFKPELHGHSF